MDQTQKNQNPAPKTQVQQPKRPNEVGSFSVEGFVKIFNNSNMLILTHIGHNLPSYINDFITQFRKFNSDYDTVFLVNKSNCENPIFLENNIKTYPIEELISERINIFLNR